MEKPQSARNWNEFNHCERSGQARLRGVDFYAFANSYVGQFQPNGIIKDQAQLKRLRLSLCH